MLSSDLQKNILAALLRLGAVRKIKGYVGFDHPCFPGWYDWLKRQPTKIKPVGVIQHIDVGTHPLEST